MDFAGSRDVRRIEQQRALELLGGLADYVLSGHGDVQRLADVQPPELRLRLSDDRVRFRDHGDRIEILRVLHRREAYR